MICNYLTTNWQDILSFFGLLFTLAGAVLTVWPMRITPEEAGKKSVSRIAPNNPDDYKKTAAAVALLRASKQATWGLRLIAIGSALQIIPIFVRLIG